MKEKINIGGIILGMSFGIVVLLAFGSISYIDYTKITDEQRLAALNRLGGVEGLNLMYLTYAVLPSALILVLYFGWESNKKDA